ncbi:site-specific integrase, partial [Salmonella enterica]|nr:site-specific integrase [Salmonella enterica]
QYHQSFIDTLCCFATTKSASYTYQVFTYFYDYMKITKNGLITTISLEKYHNKTFFKKPNGLKAMRAFLGKWLALGYYGVSDQHVNILTKGNLKKKILGEFIRTKDPEKGPISENDIILFNEGAMWLYESGDITLEQLTVSLLTSYTGRRPIQTSHLKIKDILNLFNDNDNYFVINYPRAKHSGVFRSEFTKLKIIEELNELVVMLANKNIDIFEQWLSRKVNKDEMKEIPLFIDYKKLSNQKCEEELFDFMTMDYFHIKKVWVTRTIKYIARRIHALAKGETFTARRFRYALGTRAAQEGYSEYVIARLLDHRCTNCVSVYVQNVPEHANRIDEMMTSEIIKYVNAFKGEIIHSDLGIQKIRNHKGESSGNCSNCKDCNACVPIPCYTCVYFKPWLDAPHQEIYDYLLEERKRIAEITKDTKVTFALDRTISAVLEVINKCNYIKGQERGYGNHNKY